MPTYEYACRTCGEGLEAVQSFTDEPLTECPACKGVLRKVYGNIGIAFKGSGFYKTDSRSSGNGKRSDSGREGAGDSAGDRSPAKDSSGSKEPTTPSASQSSSSSKDAAPTKGGAKGSDGSKGGNGSGSSSPKSGSKAS